MFAKHMNMSILKTLLGLLPVCYLLCSMLASPGCANITAPMGGPKDTIPPLLLKATPENYKVGFAAKSIILEFNEYIEIAQLQNELIVNPPFDKAPDISSKMRNISIKIKDTLQPNTTYSFYFGDAIKDINEGNPVSQFRYVFSTGNYIDSLQINGTIIDAETGLPDSTLSVLLHSSNDDSAVANLKPRYVAKPNGRGEFQFVNLAEGDYYLFALKDEGFKRYTSNKTPFAFYGKPVKASDENEPYELRAFIGEKDEPKPSNGSPSLEPSGNAKKKTETLPLRVSFGANESQQQDLLAPLNITFSRKVASIDSSKLHFTDTNDVVIKGYRLQLDTTGTNATLIAAWKDETFYKLRMEKGFATDSAGAINGRADTLIFKTKSESEYGNLKMQINGLDTAKHPVLQWVQNNQVVQSFPVLTGKINIPLFTPGEYIVRILYDVNQNGKWDSGDYWKKIQPEFVVAIEQKFTIRANWENDFEINL